MTGHAPLAQLDRASGYGPEGRGFESLRAYQNHGNSLNFRGFVFDFCSFPDGLILRYRSDPNRDPYGSLERKAPERKFPAAFAARFCMEAVTWAQVSRVNPAK